MWHDWHVSNVQLTVTDTLALAFSQRRFKRALWNFAWWYLHLALAYTPVSVPRECNKRVLKKVEFPVVGCCFQLLTMEDGGIFAILVCGRIQTHSKLGFDVSVCVFCFRFVYGRFCRFDLKKGLHMGGVLCICIWQNLIVLRWPCAVDRMLKSNY